MTCSVLYIRSSRRITVPKTRHPISILHRQHPLRHLTTPTNAALFSTPVSGTGIPLLALLLGCSAAGTLIEQKIPLVSAPVAAMAISMLLSAAGIIPLSAPLYDIIWDVIMPFGAACYLLDTPDLGNRNKNSSNSNSTTQNNALSTTKQTIISFSIGSIGTILGTLLAFNLFKQALLLPVAGEGAKIACCLCASYIGGSINFAAVAKTLHVSPFLIGSTMMADNLLMAVYIAVIMSLPAKDPSLCCTTNNYNNNTDNTSSNASLEDALPTSTTMVMSLSAAAVSCLVGNMLGPRWSMAGMAVFASLLGFLGTTITTTPTQKPFKGAAQIGSVMMLLFFCSIGAMSGNIEALRKGAVGLLGMVTALLVVHLVVIIGVARKWMGLDMACVLIASNANVGGPGTASAMAAAKGWKCLIQPAILTGSVGYIIANPIALALHKVMLTM